MAAPLGERLVVALVRGVHGLRGAVRVEALTDRPVERFAPGSRLHREGHDEPLTIASSAVDGPGWRLQFEEVPDRTAAETLRGAYLEAVVGAGDALGRGEYYWHEVIGATVRDVADRELGTVVDVYRAGGVDAYVVRGEAYGEFDVPAVRDFIRVFVPRRGEIVVDVDALELSRPKPRASRPPRPRRARARRPGTTPAVGSQGESDPGTSA
jgi:16S rRNA processing protein RimM